MNKLICYDWTLCDREYSSYRALDRATGTNFTDIQAIEKCIRVFGTKKQIKEVENK